LIPHDFVNHLSSLFLLCIVATESLALGPIRTKYNLVSWHGGADAYMTCNLGARAPEYVGRWAAAANMTCIKVRLIIISDIRMDIRGSMIAGDVTYMMAGLPILFSLDTDSKWHPSIRGLHGHQDRTCCSRLSVRRWLPPLVLHPMRQSLPL